MSRKTQHMERIVDKKDKEIIQKKKSEGKRYVNEEGGETDRYRQAGRQTSRQIDSKKDCRLRRIGLLKINRMRANYKS